MSAILVGLEEEPHEWRKQLANVVRVEGHPDERRVADARVARVDGELRATVLLPRTLCERHRVHYLEEEK